MNKEFFRLAFLRILIFISLAATAACTGIDKVLTPTPVSPTVEASPTHTFKPTQTFTPEPTQTPTIVPTQTPPENPGTFAGVGTIDSIEQYQGKWYGIDSVGRAEIVQDETGKWTKYDRPIIVDANSADMNVIPENLLSNDVSLDNVTRLNKGGILLPFGIVKLYRPYDGGDEISPPFDGSHFAHVFVSGVNLGTFPSPDIIGDYKPATVVVFGVPLRFKTEIITVFIPDENYTFLNLFSIPQSGDVGGITQKTDTFHNLGTMLSNSYALKRQMVLAFQINNGLAPDALTGSSVDDASLVQIFDSLNSSGANTAPIPLTVEVSWAWVPSALNK